MVFQKPSSSAKEFPQPSSTPIQSRRFHSKHHLRFAFSKLLMHQVSHTRLSSRVPTEDLAHCRKVVVVWGRSVAPNKRFSAVDEVGMVMSWRRFVSPQKNVLLRYQYLCKLWYTDSLVRTKKLCSTYLVYTHPTSHPIPSESS